MLKNIKHSARTIQPTVGGLAYWSVDCAPMFSINNYGRTPSEGWDGVFKEGWDD